MKEIKVVAKSVNSKTLYKEVNDTIYGSIETLGVKWTSESHRCSFIEIIEDYLLDLEDEGKIIQSKVICDKRNNKSFSSLAKEVVFEARFTQVGCINTTSLCYHIKNVGPRR